MNNIIYDDEIITPKNDRHTYYNNFIKRLEQKDCVKFALFCAKSVNPNTKESNLCISLAEKCLVDEKSINIEELRLSAFTAAGNAGYTDAVCAAVSAVYSAANAIAYTVSTTLTTASTYSTAVSAAYYAAYSAYYAYYAAYISDTAKMNKYLQILLRKTKQFKNNKILEQISKTDVDKLELVDWNMITDIIQEEYNIVHEFEYCDIFSRRCLIELLRREYT